MAQRPLSSFYVTKLRKMIRVKEKTWSCSIPEHSGHVWCSYSTYFGPRYAHFDYHPVTVHQWNRRLSRRQSEKWNLCAKKTDRHRPGVTHSRTPNGIDYNGSFAAFANSRIKWRWSLSKIRTGTLPCWRSTFAVTKQIIFQQQKIESQNVKESEEKLSHLTSGSTISGTSGTASGNVNLRSPLREGAVEIA